MEPARQNIEREAEDKLVGGKYHDSLAARAIAAIVLVTEGHACPVERKLLPVADNHEGRITREKGQHRLRPRERWLGTSRRIQTQVAQAWPGIHGCAMISAQDSQDSD